jgi:hypothetical protein
MHLNPSHKLSEAQSPDCAATDQFSASTLQNDQKTGDKSREGFACHNFGFRAHENGQIDQKAR